MIPRKGSAIFGYAVACLIFVGCETKEPESAMTPPRIEPVATPAPSPNPSPTPTASPTPSPSPTPTASPTPSPSPTPTASPTPSPSPTQALSRVRGVTIDGIFPTADIVESLSRLDRRPTTRVVFDEFMPATHYAPAVRSISSMSDVMGEILDSFYMKDYTTAAFRARTIEYVDLMKEDVDIWEIGNEVNGEWLGDPVEVIAKISASFDEVKARGEVAALTLYYNEDCWRYSWEEVFTWAKNRLPERMKTEMDYVFLSYYEEDCNNLRPDWSTAFQKLGEIFPNSKLGFGEVGTATASKKEEYLRRYYAIDPGHERFVGGYFWWYFRQDMVPYTQPLWSVINEVL